MKPIKKTSDLVPHDRNPNKGTLGGRVLLEKSIERYGIGRGITVDKNNKIISGNQTVETLVDKGLEKTVTVDTTGDTLVITRRVDLDLDKDAKARELAVADNRVGQVDLEWDADVLQELKDDGIDIVRLGFADADLLPNEAEKHWLGMPEYLQEDQMPLKTLYVHFRSEKAIAKFAELVGQHITSETKSIWFPAATKRKVADKRYARAKR